MRKTMWVLAFMLSQCCALASTMGGQGNYSFYQATPVVTAWVQTASGNQPIVQASTTIQGYVNVSGIPPSIYHQARVTITVTQNGTVVAGGSPQYGPQVSPSTNMNYTASITFQAADSVDYLIDETDQVFCSFEGTYFAFFSFPTIKAQWGYDFNWYDDPAGVQFLNKCYWAVANPTQCDSVTRTAIDPLTGNCYPSGSETNWYVSMLDMVPWFEVQINSVVKGVGFNGQDTQQGSMSPPAACTAIPPHLGVW